MKRTHNAEWIDRLMILREILDPDRIPANLLEEAVHANPWFSAHEIRRSLKGIRQWLEADLLTDFLGRYNKPPSAKLNVGVIAAGNLPLVCMHDVLAVLISGNRLWLKPSSQDKVLIQWIMKNWISTSPKLSEEVNLVEYVQTPDCLIATGSNNTARYLESEYGHIPRLIRKNRFSVGLLGEWTSGEDVCNLMEDIFSYNGLGCRNVTNLVILPGFAWEMWETALRNFPQTDLHPLYLERYLSVKVQMQMQGKNFQDGHSILRLPSADLQYNSMAVIHEVTLGSMEEWEVLARKHREHIQCIVGTEVPYGAAQYPAIDDFADGVDTIQWLQNCCK